MTEIPKGLLLRIWTVLVAKCLFCMWMDNGKPGTVWHTVHRELSQTPHLKVDNTLIFVVFGISFEQRHLCPNGRLICYVINEIPVMAHYLVHG